MRESTKQDTTGNQLNLLSYLDKNTPNTPFTTLPIKTERNQSEGETPSVIF
jgi:hypothetical protein